MLNFVYLFFQSSSEDIFSINFQRVERREEEERERNRDRDRVRNIDLRDTLIGCFLHEAHQARIEPTTEVCAVDWELNPQPLSLRAVFNFFISQQFALKFSL